jgi:bifunctional non-homologous end joining protein LigD
MYTTGGGNDALIYPELLQDASDAMVQRLMADPNWVWQEKHNGDRRLVEKQGDRIVDYNRHAGRGKGLSPNVVAALKRHPLRQFVIDCEFVGAEDRLHVFDALHLGDYNVVNEKYLTRLEYLHVSFDKFHASHSDIVPIESAFAPETKVALFERLQKERAEGFVMKDLRAPYRQSNPSGTLRFNYRYKFVKTLDAVVIGDTTERDDKGMLKNSVRLGVSMPNGFLTDICGATKKSAFVLKPMDVVEITYLYGTGTYDVVQPRINRLRDDKRAQECTVDQIIVNKNWRRKGA